MLNFSQVSGCHLKARFTRLNALKKPPATTKQFLYNALLNSSYRQIIETQLPIDSNIIWGDHNGPFEFDYRGVKEKVHAVAVVDGEPHLVKVIIVNEPIIVETLRINYDSVYVSLQALMKLSGQTGNPEIKKSIILAVNTEEFSVTKMILEADETEQENVKLKIDYILDTDSQPIAPSKSEKNCTGCNFIDICEGKTIPVASCSTCAFYSDKETKSCALGNSVGVKCSSHLYNPLLMVNHKHVKVDVQNLYVEYDDFINCNSEMGFKPSLTSDEMKSSNCQVNPVIEMLKKEFNGKVV